ncbi:DUF2946 family protein [Bradyrhizobium neotropicale]|uniref:DUF2946 family protein n=1 Tax=Bradyrhizobium neotropicale TaxID=1497615 RepID=UPI001AD65372|nr:DUF2946 family protein [Bradyrhizobium neotropicale]MBO4222089.1 DUF2946 domain-containing protein [Bradyrhizobium neotropicale]
MKWIRKHVKLGARLALFALAVQFVLSFGHFHPAQAAPALQTATSQTDFLRAADLVVTDAASLSAPQQQSPHQDNHQQPADGCAICAVITMAHGMLFATPPVLLLPQAIELLQLTTEAGFAHLGATHRAFQSRAPPLS